MLDALKVVLPSIFCLEQVKAFSDNGASGGPASALRRFLHEALKIKDPYTNEVHFTCARCFPMDAKVIGISRPRPRTCR